MQEAGNVATRQFRCVRCGLPTLRQHLYTAMDGDEIFGDGNDSFSDFSGDSTDPSGFGGHDGRGSGGGAVQNQPYDEAVASDDMAADGGLDSSVDTDAVYGSPDRRDPPYNPAATADVSMASSLDAPSDYMDSPPRRATHTPPGPAVYEQDDVEIPSGANDVADREEKKGVLDSPRRIGPGAVQSRRDAQGGKEADDDGSSGEGSASPPSSGVRVRRFHADRNGGGGGGRDGGGGSAVVAMTAAVEAVEEEVAAVAAAAPPKGWTLRGQNGGASLRRSKARAPGSHCPRRKRKAATTAATTMAGSRGRARARANTTLLCSLT